MNNFISGDSELSSLSDRYSLGRSIHLPILLFAFLIQACTQVKPGADSIHEMKLDVEITPEGDGAFTIKWSDTLGNFQNFNKFNRPFEIVCDIIDQEDTAGYYHGLNVPSTWTSFGTNDSVITVYFSIARNVSPDLPPDMQMKYPDISCDFNPVRLNTRSQLRKKIPLLLTKKNVEK